MRATRRQLLGASALLLVAGCRDAPAPAPPPPPVDPDDALRAAAVDREQVVVRAYDAALLAAPSLAARLAPLRAEHVEHLAALGGPPPPGGPVAASTPPAPAPPAAVLAGLVRAEQAAGAGHGAAVGAASRPLAALLAVLAASEASHPVVLA